jgi:hypothetical protein
VDDQRDVWEIAGEQIPEWIRKSAWRAKRSKRFGVAGNPDPENVQCVESWFPS